MQMDRMLIRDLEVDCIIGTKPEEREKKQKVVVNLELECDLSRPGETDHLGDTLNYRSLKKALVRHIESSQYMLIERLADRLAHLSLQNEMVKSVKVTVDKPHALSKARSVAVEIARQR